MKMIPPPDIHNTTSPQPKKENVYLFLPAAAFYRNFHAIKYPPSSSRTLLLLWPKGNKAKHHLVKTDCSEKSAKELLRQSRFVSCVYMKNLGSSLSDRSRTLIRWSSCFRVDGTAVLLGRTELGTEQEEPAWFSLSCELQKRGKRSFSERIKR